ncbi:MAG: TPR end-of-group domain-containing protein [Candidatus Thorarchaeota archaeon]|jgi:tetratricopeptide (TPR) repeat protein
MGALNEWALWNQLGHVLVAKTDYNDAVDAFRKATELDSSSFFSWLSLGYASKEAKDLATAISSTKHAMSLAETPLHQGMVLYNLACYTCLIGEKEKALSYLRQCFEKDASIKDWAREDPDLKALETDARYIRLLET